MYYISDQTVEFYEIALDSVITTYNQGGFTIKYIYCDNEFCTLVNIVASKNHVTMNYANPQEHVPETNRDNRVIKKAL